MPEDLPILEDDGLLTPLTGKWAERKYKLVKYCCHLFAKSMLGKWDCRAYIDLFAGAGRVKIKPTMRIVPASPLLAVDIPNRFDRYIFCEMDQDRINALRQRISRDFPQVPADFIEGDVNDNVSSILAAIPQPSSRFTVLSFCFADPFSVSNLQFDTIRSLSKMYMDFLVLIPAYMDARRNLGTYLNQDDMRVEEFLGLSSWRSEWSIARSSGMGFGTFIVDQFGLQMKQMSFKYDGLHDTVLVREPGRNLPLYRLAFFSRSDLGVKFWRQARKYTRDQLALFDLL